MTAELTVLFYSGLFTFALIFLQGLQVPLNYGFKWGLGNRDQPQEPTIFMQRIARTLNNQLQAMAIAVPALIVLAIYPQAQSTVTQIGAWVFLFGRITFAIAYLAGIPYLRSVVWGIGVTGWLMMVYGIVIAL